MYDRTRLLHRRQFILSSRLLDRFTGWQTGLVGGAYHLRAHPDLGLAQAASGERELTLLGYLIDPHHPDWDDERILAELLAGISDRESLFKYTKSLAGRWVLFYFDGHETTAFNDPCGYRTLYYTRPGVEPFTCASQPGLIIGPLGLAYSAEARRDYLETAAFKQNKEYWLPSGPTLYEEIAHLVPNHYLALETRAQARFWPWKRRTPVDFQTGVEQASTLLQELMAAAASRFPLAVTLTAGYDTRSILAASRKLRDEPYYYTLIYYNLSRASPEVDIPSKLLAAGGHEHHILDCSGEMDEAFRELYMGSVDLAHEAWGHIACGLYHAYPSDRMSVKGASSEIARMTSSRYGYLEVLDGETLAEIFFMKDSPFAVRHFDEWARASLPVIDAHDYRALDVFYWEHKLGNWQALSQLEWDIVQETFCPYNCRELLELLLGVDERYRKKPAQRLISAMIAGMWPAMAKQPFNPRPLKIALRKRFRLVWRSKRFKRLRKTLRKLLGKDGGNAVK